MEQRVFLQASSLGRLRLLLACRARCTLCHSHFPPFLSQRPKCLLTRLSKVHFFCDIAYDVFRFMRDNGLVYGFNMNILDDARSFPSLWNQTLSFMQAHPNLVHPEADLEWVIDRTPVATSTFTTVGASGPGATAAAPAADAGMGDYNNCQFFSNFEIGDLRFFRSKENEMYFDWLDHAGGFHYERYGDAPIHTLSVTMLRPKNRSWFFRDIGYQHDVNRYVRSFVPTKRSSNQ